MQPDEFPHIELDPELLNKYVNKKHTISERRFSTPQVRKVEDQNSINEHTKK